MNAGIKLPSCVQEILADFMLRITGIDSLSVQGIYLTGSIPMNDFHADKSDIDFLVLCRELPDLETAGLLKKIHRHISRRHHKPNLSGAYLRLADIKSCAFESIKTLTYHEGKMHYQPLDMAPIVLKELKTNAYTFFGVKAETLPFEVKEYELNHFLHVNINSYWTNRSRQYTSSFPHSLLLLLFPRLTEWSVLSVARQLCTLQTGRIVSKTEAGQYCLGQLPEIYYPIIRQAIKIRNTGSVQLLLNRYKIKLAFKRRRQTIACVNYIIAAFNEIYQQKTSSPPGNSSGI